MKYINFLNDVVLNTEKYFKHESDYGDIFNLCKITKENPSEIIQYIDSDKFMKVSYSGKFSFINEELLINKSIYMEKFDVDTFKQFRRKSKHILALHAIVGSWSRYKQAYVFDKDFVQYLIHTDNIKIPVEIFDNLPYDTFYLDLARYRNFGNWVGCIVKVSKPDKEEFPIISVLGLGIQEGKRFVSTSFLGQKEFRDKDRIKSHEGKTYFEFDKSVIDDELISDNNKKVDTTRTQICNIWTFVVQSIIYLSSYKPDVKQRDQSLSLTHTQHNKTIKHQAQIIINDVGIRHGNTIRINQKDVKRHKYSNDSNQENKNKQTKSAHVRRAHWHTYRVGKDRSETIVKWLPPMFICGNGKLPTTVHPVKLCK